MADAMEERLKRMKSKTTGTNTGNVKKDVENLIAKGMPKKPTTKKSSTKKK